MTERLTYRDILDEGWTLDADLLRPPPRWRWLLRDLQLPHLIDGVPRSEFRAVRSQMLAHLELCDTLTASQKGTLRRAGWHCGHDSRWRPPGDAYACERRVDGGEEDGLIANDAWRVHSGYGCLLVC